MERTVEKLIIDYENWSITKIFLQANPTFGFAFFEKTISCILRQNHEILNIN